MFENNDFELWLQEGVQKEINEKWSCRLNSEFRFARGASFLYLTYAEFLFVYQPSDWLELVGGYRQLGVFSPLTKKLEPVENPLIDLIFYFSSKEWKWSNRNRVQYIIPSGVVKNFWVYRNRLRLTSPWKLTQIKLIPFVDDEVFFRERVGFSENRFAIGGTVQPPDSYHVRTFYMLRHIKLLDRWTHQNILGLYFSFSF
ncbi:MAG: DUF2490 domain-containing protein [Chlamydiales bacterium]